MWFLCSKLWIELCRASRTRSFSLMTIRQTGLLRWCGRLRERILVSACCSKTAVLDFGKLIASGDTAEVLRNDEVKKAYLGVEAVAV